MPVCEKCLLEKNEDLIATDHFYGGEIKLYCSDCFYEKVKVAFNDSSLTCKCGRPMVLQINEKEEIIDLAKENEPIFFECEIISEARKSVSSDLEKLEDAHDEIGLYAFQPE